MITQNELVGYIKNAKVGELHSLIASLEDELGVKAAVPQVFTTQPRTYEPTEQVEFDVVLNGWDQENPKAKMNVIKVVRKLTGLGLKESKALVETPNVKLCEAVDKDVAEETAAAIREAGGTVEIK